MQPRAFRFGTYLITILLIAFLAPLAADLFFPLSYEERLTEARYIDTQLPPLLLDQLHHDGATLDLLFMGSSILNQNIAVPVVQNDLRQKSGREIHAFMACFTRISMVNYYYYLKEILQHRQVRNIILQADMSEDERHHLDPDVMQLWNFPESWKEISVLPISYRLKLISIYLLTGPRRLMTHLRNVSYGIISDWNRFIALNYEGNGSYLSHHTSSKPHIFQELSFPFTALAAEDVLSLSSVPEESYLKNAAGELEQLYFDKIKKICAENNIQIYFFLSPPRPAPQEMESEKKFFPQTNFLKPGEKAHFMSVSPKQFLGQVSPEKISDIYLDDFHFNQNGSLRMTNLLLPTFEKIVLGE